MTNEIEGEEYNDINETTKTRTFSYCFQSYQTRDFEKMGNIFKRIIRSIWFGYGLMNTNSIEGLWPKFKRLNNNFSGLSVSMINVNFTTDEQKIEYLDA